jgi:LacI family transcriptional regulator
LENQVPITIFDIAREAGVSHATVSRALNNKGDLSPATRARVLAVAEKLHYVPSSVARALVSGQTRTFGLIVSNNASPFFSEIVRVIEGTTNAAGFGLLLCNSAESQEQALRCLAMLLSKQVDAIILTPVQSDTRDVALLQRSGIPYLLLLRRFADLAADSVVLDNVKGGYLVTDHLLCLGHRRIGHVAGPSHIFSAEGRLAGYRKALEERGVPYDDGLVVNAGFTVAGGYEAAMVLLERARRPAPGPGRGEPATTAIFASTDLQAVGVLKAARELGLRIPDDVALTGGDDIELAEYLEVPLTTFRQPAHEIGARSVEILLARLAGDQSAPRQVVLDPELVVRRSSGHPIIEEELYT